MKGDIFMQIAEGFAYCTKSIRITLVTRIKTREIRLAYFRILIFCLNNLYRISTGKKDFFGKKDFCAEGSFE